MNIKLPYGMKEGKLVHIDEVERGIACGCFCPGCNHPLVARKGEQTVHHFAHHKGKECEHAVETALHLAAKDILEKVGWMHVPAAKLDSDRSFDDIELWEVSPKQKIHFDRVVLEKRFDGFVPDVVAYVGERPLLIEVTVTHKTDEEKIEKIKAAGLSVVEIDLSKADRDMPADELEHIVIGPSDKKKWLLNQRVESMDSIIERESVKVEHEYKPRCPFGRWKNGYRPTVDYEGEDICRSCAYFGGYESWEDGEGRVRCLGKIGVSSPKAMKDYLRSKRDAS